MSLHLDSLPNAPGVYLMKNRSDEVVYVGKAINLKKRVSSYFNLRNGSDLRPAARHVKEEVEHVEFIATRNENEAFILENNLIKKLKPRYNIRLKDDKSFLSLRVDLKHPFPRIVPVRRPKDDGCLYFGPYPSSRALRATLRFLRTLFPLRSCTDREFKSRKRPCIQHQIGRCPAPCVGLVEKDAYRRNLDKVLAVLRGQVEDLLHGLEQEMEDASREMAFEKAALFRDRIGHLKVLSQSQKVEDARFQDVDAIGTWTGEGATGVSVLFYRQGKLVASQPYTFTMELDEEELMEQFLSRFYGENRTVPEKVLLSTAPADLEGLQRQLAALRGGASFELSLPRRGPAVRLIRLARENARLFLKTTRESLEHTAEVESFLAGRLGLRAPPAVIEGMDISTTGGCEAVGVVVRFERGVPHKNRYRRYRIKTVEGMDDFAMLAEVVRRRLKRGRAEGDLPDLILVDGGLGQLNRAREAAAELGEESVEFLALQKGSTRAKAVSAGRIEDDQVVAPRLGVTDAIPSGSPALYLLQRIRDEAHRFAIAYHRKRRQKESLASPLDEVEGLGSGRKRNLLAWFGGLRGLRGASREEISRVPGVGSILAERIYQALHE